MVGGRETELLAKFGFRPKQSANQVRVLLLRPFGCLFMFNLDMR